MTNPETRLRNFPSGDRPLPGIRVDVLIALYVAIGVAPLVLAIAQGYLGRSIWRELSAGLAMIAFAMMLVQFLLSGRLRRVSGKVGIDITMRFHQLVAWTILAFVVVHPLLYAVPRLHPDPADALAVLQRMFASPGLRTGVIAWWLTIFLVLLAVFRDRLPFRYEVWRLSHGAGALAIAALGLDHTLQAGTHSGGPALAAFWAVLAAVAAASLVRVYAVKPMARRRAPWRLVANERAAERTHRLVVEPVNGAGIDFAAGQFAWLNLGHSPFGITEHPFSISSAPADRPRLEFTVKESGDFTSRIGEIPVGTTAYLDGPHGAFTLAGRTATRLVLIAGGVGFAPVIGILRQLRAESWDGPVTLVYGNRLESQILYRDEIEGLRGALDLDAHLVLSEPPAGWDGPVGELSPDVLARCLGAPEPGALYLVCGPVPMMDAVERALADMGVPAERVVSERFKYE